MYEREAQPTDAPQRGGDRYYAEQRVFLAAPHGIIEGEATTWEGRLPIRSSPKGERILDSKKEVSFARLADWVEGRLPIEKARGVEEQMAMADSATLADLAWLGAFFKVSEKVILQSPPPDVRNKLVHCFGAYGRAGGRPDVVPRVRGQCGPEEDGK